MAGCLNRRAMVSRARIVITAGAVAARPRTLSGMIPRRLPLQDNRDGEPVKRRATHDTDRAPGAEVDERDSDEAVALGEVLLERSRLHQKRGAGQPGQRAAA